MVSEDGKYKSVNYRKAAKKYVVGVAIRKGEEDKAPPKYQGKKKIHGGLFSDPFFGVQTADKIYACLGRPRSESNESITEAEYATAATAGWAPLLEFIESRNLSISGAIFSRGSSMMRGVSWDKSRKRWSSNIRSVHGTVRLYRGESEVEAALAYDSANHYLHGSNPESKSYRLNFIYSEGEHSTPSGFPGPPSAVILAKLQAAQAASKKNKASTSTAVASLAVKRARPIKSKVSRPSSSRKASADSSDESESSSSSDSESSYESNDESMDELSGEGAESQSEEEEEEVVEEEEEEEGVGKKLEDEVSPEPEPQATEHEVNISEQIQTWTGAYRTVDEDVGLILRTATEVEWAQNTFQKLQIPFKSSIDVDPLMPKFRLPLILVRYNASKRKANGPTIEDDNLGYYSFSSRMLLSQKDIFYLHLKETLKVDPKYPDWRKKGVISGQVTDDMERWLQSQLIPSLEDGRIVLDNDNAWHPDQFISDYLKGSKEDAANWQDKLFVLSKDLKERGTLREYVQWELTTLRKAEAAEKLRVRAAIDERVKQQSAKLHKERMATMFQEEKARLVAATLRIAKTSRQPVKTLPPDEVLFAIFEKKLEDRRLAGEAQFLALPIEVQKRRTCLDDPNHVEVFNAVKHIQMRAMKSMLGSSASEADLSSFPLFPPFNPHNNGLSPGEILADFIDRATVQIYLQNVLPAIENATADKCMASHLASFPYRQSGWGSELHTEATLHQADLLYCYIFDEFTWDGRKAAEARAEAMGRVKKALGASLHLGPLLPYHLEAASQGRDKIVMKHRSLIKQRAAEAKLTAEEDRDKIVVGWDVLSPSHQFGRFNRDQLAQEINNAFCHVYDLMNPRERAEADAKAALQSKKGGMKGSGISLNPTLAPSLAFKGGGTRPGSSAADPRKKVHFSPTVPAPVSVLVPPAAPKSKTTTKAYAPLKTSMKAPAPIPAAASAPAPAPLAPVPTPAPPQPTDAEISAKAEKKKAKKARQKANKAAAGSSATPAALSPSDSPSHQLSSDTEMDES